MELALENTFNWRTFGDELFGGLISFFEDADNFVGFDDDDMAPAQPYVIQYQNTCMSSIDSLIFADPETSIFKKMRDQRLEMRAAKRAARIETRARKKEERLARRGRVIDKYIRNFEYQTENEHLARLFFLTLI